MTRKTTKLIGDITFYLFFVVLFFIILCQVGVFPYRMVFVRSGSMAPTFNTGDLAVVRVDPNYAPKVGDIILFSDSGSDVIHRVIMIDGAGITTKGDYENNAPDVEKVTQPRGYFLFSIPLMGYVFVFVQRNIFWIIALILLGILVDLLHSNKLFPFNKRQ